MCGIAGYSLSSRSSVDRAPADQARLAGIAERGADAVGYAHRGPGGSYAVVTKQRTPASQLLERIAVPQTATELHQHVRNYPKGHPSISPNNHPVRHGPVVGIHNGIIVNDDELLAAFDCARAEPRMTVDSEAIFALAAHSRNEPAAFEALLGSMATAWLDEREPGTVFAARGIGRPLWLGAGRHELFFASTRTALEVVEEYAHVRLKKRELKDGTFLAIRNAKIVRDERFQPDPRFEEPSKPLPAVRVGCQRARGAQAGAAPVAAGGPLVGVPGAHVLAGPQAGVAGGARALAAGLRKNPWIRALRIDKFTVAALEATLYAYEAGTALETVPTLRLLTEPLARVRSRARAVLRRLPPATRARLAARVVDDRAQVGGGALPTVELPTAVLAIGDGPTGARPPLRRSHVVPTARHPRRAPGARPPLQRSHVVPTARHPRRAPGARPPLRRSHVVPTARHPRRAPGARPPLQRSHVVPTARHPRRAPGARPPRQ